MGEKIKRILSLDYGSKTVGVAVSDPLNMSASPVETIKRERPGALRPTVRRVAELVLEYDIGLIVIGYPLMLSGDVSDRCRATDEFIALIEKRCDVPIMRIDERLTTREADEMLSERGVPKKDRKSVIDQVAAGLILQDYLDNRGKYDRYGKDQVF